MISQLAVYLAGLFTAYYVLLIRAVSGYQGRLFVMFSLAALGSIAVLRGNVGTDTANYEVMVGVLRSPTAWYGVEPGFAALTAALGVFSPSDIMLVRLLAIVFIMGLVRFVWRSDKDELFYLLVFYIPASFYQHSMNAVRLGLASIFILLATQNFRRNNRAGMIAWLLVGFSFHYSTALIAIYLAAVGRVFKLKASALVFIFVALALGGLSLIYNNYLWLRIGNYQEYSSPEKLSGTSQVVIVLMVLAGVMGSRLASFERWLLLSSGLALLLMFWLMAHYTYAGLRFLDLIKFMFPLAILIAHGRGGLQMNAVTRGSLAGAGIVATASVLRSFAISAGQGKTPWLPYEWVF